MPKKEIVLDNIVDYLETQINEIYDKKLRCDDFIQCYEYQKQIDKINILLEQSIYFWQN